MYVPALNGDQRLHERLLQMTQKSTADSAQQQCAQIDTCRRDIICILHGTATWLCITCQQPTVFNGLRCLFDSELTAARFFVP